MRHCVKLVLLLFILALAMPSSVLAASEGGHGGGDSKKKEKSDKKEKGDKKEAAKAENGVIAIGPLVVNILSNKGYRFFRLGMLVECADNESAERLVKADAKEDLILMLSSKLADDLLSNSGKMVLRKELMDLFSKYAGPGKVKNIYFSEFVFQ